MCWGEVAAGAVHGECDWCGGVSAVVDGGGDLRFSIRRADVSWVAGDVSTSPSPKSVDVLLTGDAGYLANVWSVSGVGVFELTITEDLPYTSPPSVPGGLGVSAVGVSTVDLVWAASTDNDAVSSYEVFRDGGLVGTSAVTVFGDQGLAPETTFEYTVRAVDASGNRSGPSSALIVTTLADGPPDETPPDPPTNLGVTAATESSISLSWTAAVDDRAVTGYEVYRDGGLAGSTTVTAFTDEGLAADQTYAYTVRAFDAAGNISTDSNTLIATTESRPPERVLVSGTADSSGVLGARWRRVPFTANATGVAVFRLSWTGGGDLRFSIRRADVSWVAGDVSTSPSPKSVDVLLTGDAGYLANVWSVSGVGVFELTITEDLPDTSPPSVPGGLGVMLWGCPRSISCGLRRPTTTLSVRTRCSAMVDWWAPRR